MRTRIKPTVEPPVSRFSRNIETTLLVERIRKMEPGETVPYEELSEIIGQDIQAEGYSAAHSARRICQQEYQVVTDAITNVGYRRLTDIEITSSGPQRLRRVRRHAIREVDRITSVSDFDSLPNDEKTRHNAMISALRVMEIMAKPKSLNRIAGAVGVERTGELPIARTLELFRGPKKV